MYHHFLLYPHPRIKRPLQFRQRILKKKKKDQNYRWVTISKVKSRGKGRLCRVCERFQKYGRRYGIMKRSQNQPDLAYHMIQFVYTVNHLRALFWGLSKIMFIKEPSKIFSTLQAPNFSILHWSKREKQNRSHNEG